MKTIIILLAALAAVVVLANDKPVVVEAVPADPGVQQALRPEPTPMMQEILASQEAARIRVEELRKHYEATTDDQMALEIMREVAQVKKESRIEVMRIQLKYAIARGDDATVAELEEIVARMEAPPRKGVPISRVNNHE